MLRRLFCLVLFAAGCSSTTGSGPLDCDAGFIVDNGECRKLCATDFDCSAGQICQGSSICAPGARADVPVVATVEGDGSPDGAPGHTQNHLARRIVVTGEHFDGAAVTLTDGSTEWPLAVCSTSNTQLTLELPDTLIAGNHILNVANQAGACNATLPILEGQMGAPGMQGPTGPLPNVLAQGGLQGTGAAGSPLQVDYDAVSPRHFAYRAIEAEATTTSGLVGSSAAAVDASGGAEWISTYNGPVGDLWALYASDLGAPLGLENVTVRMTTRVANVSSAVDIASARCERLPAGTSNWATEAVSAGWADNYAPDEWPMADEWLERTLRCDFEDDDVDQRILIELLDSSVTTLAVDRVRIYPGHAYLAIGDIALQGTTTGNEAYWVGFNGGRYPGPNTVLYSENTGHPTVYLTQRRGTPLAPASTQNGDNIGIITFSGFDAVADLNVQAARLVVTAGADFETAPMAGARYPMNLDFLVGAGMVGCCGTPRMRIQGSDGFVGIGTISPQYMLDVNGQVASMGTPLTSDRRLKKNIRQLPNALERVTSLHGVRFEWADPNKGSSTQIGFIAQDVERYFPEVVSTGKNGIKGVDYAKLVAALTEALKTMHATNAQLERDLASTRSELRDLKTSVTQRLSSIERTMATQLAKR